MGLFAFRAHEHREQFDRQGWLHVRGGLDPAFLAYLQRFVAQARDEAPIEGRGIQGEKDQFVLDLPDGESWDEVHDLVSELCGLDRDTMALSERHIKAYQSDADPRPSAHKDRFASQISVGLSVHVPEGSHLVMYPDDERDPNPYLSGAHRSSLDPHEAPDEVLGGAREIEIHDEPGDVIFFHGASTWHLRRNAADTVVVYLKLNEFDCDPLGEDVTTAARRDETLRLLEQGDGALEASTAVLARRFESVSRDHRREGWPEMLHANVWGQHPFPVSEDEFALLRRLDDGAKVRDLLEHGTERTRHELRRLARRGAIDLLV
jgi:hypothetical protein